MLTSNKSNDQSTTTVKMEERQQQTKKKGTRINPNRTDKAGRTKIFYATTAGHLDKVQELVEMGADVNFVDNAGWTPLHEAALKGQFTIAKYLIECGAQVNVQGFGQDTPLHDAACNGFPDIVKLLVDCGANVFALNENNERPIDLCEEDDEARIILQKKMDALDRLIARDENGQTSLHRACLEKKLEKVNKLIQQGANVNAQDNKHQATPLHLLCTHHKEVAKEDSSSLLDIVKLLVKHSAAVDMLNSDGNTPLHEASRLGHTDVVQFLVTQASADVYIENNYGQTAYDVASYPPVRQILTARMDEVKLEKEASNALDEIAGKTAKKKEPERQLTREERKIQIYMKAFENMNNNDDAPKPKRDHQQQPVAGPTIKRRKTSSEETSPTISPSSSSSSIQKIASSPSSPIKRKGGRPKKPVQDTKLDAFKRDSSGRTQLHKYAVKGSEMNVSKLLAAGADPNAADHAGWTPLHEAALEGHLEVVKLLLDHGAHINVKGGTHQDTPLHDAAENNHCPVVELLLERGADPFARNRNGAEPIDIATEKNYTDILLVLQATNPVNRKKRATTSELVNPKNKKAGLMKESSSSSSSSKMDVKPSTPDVQPKKRRLVQAADLEKIKSPKEDEKMQVTAVAAAEEEERIVETPVIEKKYRNKRKSTKEEVDKTKLENKEDEKMVTVKIEPEEQRRYWNPRKHLYDTTVAVAPADPHSPIPTPPPEPGMTSKQKEDTLQYLPLYTVQLKKIFYVVDYQVSLLLGMNDSKQFWTAYPDLPKRLITLEEKTRLWSHLKTMLKQQDEQTFLDKPLYFTPLEDLVVLIKKNFTYLSNRLITITLDMGYQEIREEKVEDKVEEKKLSNIKNLRSLPPKMRMKLGGYVTPSSPSSS